MTAGAAGLGGMISCF